MTLRSLAEGNRLQRWYWRWASPYYARLGPHAREQAEAIDLFLYSRRGVGFWIGMLCAVTGSTVGLSMAGWSVPSALVVSLVAWAALPLGWLSAWLQPERFLGRMRRGVAAAVVLGFAGALTGFAVGHAEQHGRFDPALLAHELVSRLHVIAPAVLLVVLGLAFLQWVIARVRRQILETELERVSLQRERDAAARQAAEARLRLLQGQIHPHFLFNTLSALQHWVDTGDARAPALLRSLTAFLRRSTDALGRDGLALADEAAMADHYLAIQRARLGERLAYAIEIEPAVARVELPSGLLLTLVENAVEHGVAPALAGGVVSVRARARGAACELSVHNTGSPLPAGWADGVGLANSRERLAQHFGDRASLVLEPADGGTVARVSLPLETPAP